MPQDFTPGGHIQSTDGNWGRGAGDQRTPAVRAQQERYARADRYERESQERIVLTPEQRRAAGDDTRQSYLAGPPGTVAYLQQMVPGLSWEAATAALNIRTRFDDVTEAQAIARGIINAQDQGIFPDSQRDRTRKIHDAIGRGSVTFNENETAEITGAVNRILEGRNNYVSDDPRSRNR